jgi:hypothetical protein
VFQIAEDEDRPGHVGRVAGNVAEAGANILAVYPGTRSRGVMVTTDNDAARSAVEDASASS